MVIFTIKIWDAELTIIINCTLNAISGNKGK